MAGFPPSLPEPIIPRSKPLLRGRDGALLATPVVSAAPLDTDMRLTSGDGAATHADGSALHLYMSAPYGARRSIIPWLVVLTVVGVALAFTVPFTLGVYFGNRDREQYLERQAVEHFQRALAYESETYTELAMVELEIALRFKPDYRAAQDKLAQLKKAKEASSQEPNEVAIAKQLLHSAEGAMAREAWNEAIDLLEELRRVKQDYRAVEVQQYLVRAYLAAGRAAVAAGQMDIAQRRFERVLELEASNAEARALRERTLLYVNGVHSMPDDWQNAVLALEELYRRDPNFYDVKTQLRAAHIGYGDFASQQDAYCIAAREYEAAVALGADANVAAQAALANDRCKQAVLNPTPTPTPLPEGLVYLPRVQVNQDAVCGGVGGITGSVRDRDGTPLANVAIRIYNDYDYHPPPFRTTPEGTYAIVLGVDAGLFHLVVVNEDSSAASDIVDVDYPGGMEPGCHIGVDWIKVR